MKGGTKSHPESSFDALVREAAATPSIARSSAKPGTVLMGGRFVIERQLGEGGMGVVYEARDEKMGSRVALKALSRVDPAGIYQFKREFRSLADIVHDHLVTLHELFAEHQDWFFTMELVDGVPFTEYVRMDPVVGFEDTVSSNARTAALHETVEISAGLARSPSAASFRESLLRDAVRQLADGVQAIHRAGKLHRDLKPSNVLVTRAGRVVILDFGLASEHAHSDTTQSIERHIVGTPAYMAPEQALGERATNASDWYAVGCMLYEALSGRHPFTGSVAEILFKKQERQQPEAVWDIAIGVPSDLGALCMDLLRCEPSERPEGDEVLRRLGGDADGRTSLASLGSAAPEVIFVGRNRELVALWQAFEHVTRGDSKTVFVQGLSGMGKTTLVERFLARASSEGRAVVLRGRCHEREEVPFKALDGIVDALTRHLARLDPTAAALVLPRELHTLTRVFPVLRRVPVIARARGRVSQIEEPIELRRVAFAALRELLQRLGDRQPLVLFADDLHWADEGSAVLLPILLEPPDAPALLFIGAYRSDEVERSACLKTLLSPQSGVWKDRLTLLEVGELSSNEALELGTTLLGADAESKEQAAAIVADAGGHPYFVTELARSAKRVVGEHSAPESRRTLDGVISERVLSLPKAARKLLEVVALSGRPLPTWVAVDAAGISRADRSATLMLLTAHLARLTRIEGEDAIEAYHDRVRASVTGAVSAEERANRHRAIVQALLASGSVDPELLVEHLAGSGDFAGARAHALNAARNAAASYAYETAARLYRRALEWAENTEDEQNVRIRLAEALRDAGRATEAGWAYLEAAQRASEPRRSDFRRLAAEQLVLAGHIDAGISAVEEALAEEGLDIAPPDSALLLSMELIAEIMQRGIDFQPRAERDIPEPILRRIDLFWSVGWGLNLASLRCASFLPRHLLAALDAGEPYRVVRGLSIYAAQLAALAVDGTDDVLRRAVDAGRHTTDERAQFWIEWGRACVFAFKGRFQGTLSPLRRAERILQGLRETSSKELGTVRVSFCTFLWYGGELGELCQRIPRWLPEAEQRNDLFTGAWLHTYNAYAYLAIDDVSGALDQLRQALDMSGHRYGDWLCGFNVVTRGSVEIYGQSVTNALIHDIAAVIDGAWGVLKVQQALGTAVLVRAHLQLASRGVDSERHLTGAERSVQVIENLAFPFQRGVAAASRAGAAMIRGERARAVDLLREAVQQAQDPEARQILAPLRWRLGELLGGDEGRALVESATADMRAQGIVNPARWTAMLVPGFER